MFPFRHTFCQIISWSGKQFRQTLFKWFMRYGTSSWRESENWNSKQIHKFWWLQQIWSWNGLRSSKLWVILWVNVFSNLNLNFQSSNSKIVARPFINCLNNSNSDEMSEFILQKLSSTFISLEGRQPHSHSCLVVTIFNEIFLRFKENESKMKILLENVNQPIMEHAMMSDEIVPSRKLILNLLKNLLQSSTFRGSPELQGIVTVNLKTLTSMYLSSNSQYYFQWDLIDSLRGFFLTLIFL